MRSPFVFSTLVGLFATRGIRAEKPGTHSAGPSPSAPKDPYIHLTFCTRMSFYTPKDENATLIIDAPFSETEGIAPGKAFWDVYYDTRVISVIVTNEYTNEPFTGWVDLDLNKVTFELSIPLANLPPQEEPYSLILWAVSKDGVTLFKARTPLRILSEEEGLTFARLDRLDKSVFRYDKDAVIVNSTSNLSERSSTLSSSVFSSHLLNKSSASATDTYIRDYHQQPEQASEDFGPGDLGMVDDWQTGFFTEDSGESDPEIQRYKLPPASGRVATPHNTDSWGSSDDEKYFKHSAKGLRTMSREEMNLWLLYFITHYAEDLHPEDRFFEALDDVDTDGNGNVVLNVPSVRHKLASRRSRATTRPMPPKWLSTGSTPAAEPTSFDPEPMPIDLKGELKAPVSKGIPKESKEKTAWKSADTLGCLFDYHLAPTGFNGQPSPVQDEVELEGKGTLRDEDSNTTETMSFTTDLESADDESESKIDKYRIAVLKKLHRVVLKALKRKVKASMNDSSQSTKANAPTGDFDADAPNMPRRSVDNSDASHFHYQGVYQTPESPQINPVPLTPHGDDGNDDDVIGWETLIEQVEGLLLKALIEKTKGNTQTQDPFDTMDLNNVEGIPLLLVFLELLKSYLSVPPEQASLTPYPDDFTKVYPGAEPTTRYETTVFVTEQDPDEAVTITVTVTEDSGPVPVTITTGRTPTHPLLPRDSAMLSPTAKRIC